MFFHILEILYINSIERGMYVRKPFKMGFFSGPDHLMIFDTLDAPPDQIVATESESMDNENVYPRLVISIYDKLSGWFMIDSLVRKMFKDTRYLEELRVSDQERYDTKVFSNACFLRGLLRLFLWMAFDSQRIFRLTIDLLEDFYKRPEANDSEHSVIRLVLVNMSYRFRQNKVWILSDYTNRTVIYNELFELPPVAARTESGEFLYIGCDRDIAAKERMVRILSLLLSKKLRYAREECYELSERIVYFLMGRHEMGFFREFLDHPFEPLIEHVPNHFTRYKRHYYVNSPDYRRDP